MSCVSVYWLSELLNVPYKAIVDCECVLFGVEMFGKYSPDWIIINASSEERESEREKKAPY